MISVIIPLMAIPPYDTQIMELMDCLKKQSAEHEVLICEMEVEEFINKNRLLNQGVARAKGKLLWFCDADFLLEDPKLLEHMEEYLITGEYDVIFPMFRRKTIKEFYKIVEGGPFMRRSVMERHGPLDESIIGISYTTFPLLKWITENTRWHCSKRFIIRLNDQPRSGAPGRSHRPSRFKLQGMAKEVFRKLDAMELVNG